MPYSYTHLHGAVPQSDLSSGNGSHAEVAIPSGTKAIDFLVDVDAYVVANRASGDPFSSNNGVPYKPNLNFRLPCSGATYLHVKASGAVALKWNAIS